MGGISGGSIGQILGSLAGIPFGGPLGAGIGGQIGGAIGGAIDPQTGLSIPRESVTSDPAQAQDQSSQQLQGAAQQAQPQGPGGDPNQQLLQLLLMLANQGPQQ